MLQIGFIQLSTMQEFENMSGPQISRTIFAKFQTDPPHEIRAGLLVLPTDQPNKNTCIP
jgi:hypothetical protein